MDLSGMSYRHNFCEHKGFDRRFESVLFNKIHLDAKEVNEIILEMDKIKEGSRAVKFDKNVHIACLLLLAPDIGAEYPQVGNTIPLPEFRQV